MTKNILIKKTHFAFSAIPSIKQLAANARGESERRETLGSFQNIFPKSFEKVLTE
jgi:hypothetical protein